MPDERTEVDLPRGIALAWGVAANPQRGPKREMSIERIVEAAVEIADADGLGAVSMSAVAARLGFTTMSLYRYVSAKDDLILLMQEHGIGLPPLSVQEAQTWQDGMLAFYRANVQIYEAHPWVLDIQITGTPNTPNNLAWVEAGLVVMRDAPLTSSEKISTVLLFTGHARWSAGIARGYTRSASDQGQSTAELERAEAELIASLITEDMFPTLTAAIRAGALTDESDPFEFGLQRILEGVEHHMAARVADGATAASVARPEETSTDAHPKDPAVRQARAARREAEAKLREALRKEREAVAKAEDRAAKAADKARAQAAKERERQEKAAARKA
ncbi:TetR/AcrR family transcriptional regulator C-terminal domain-containing protein [Ruania sp. N2-46]|uniref:TetR/AcrR family transcriptional regulator C-terminal domain-containing protein n=2 Tax=Occultella gossypii TaxID=2800820 RepID=A0ABS7SAJ4_9MICO|nr:TetR/AcrR family transcriptional regulator C-terminal domain-containing protein [Occultella gossypii]